MTDLLGGDIIMPIMVLLAFLVLIILILLARASSPKKVRADDADRPEVADEVELEVLPPQDIVETDTSPIVEEVLTSKEITSPKIHLVVEEGLPPPDIIEPEIRPIMEEGESATDFRPPREETEIKDDIRPLLQKETSNGCQYCSIFRDIGTAVCPNCGRPLNLRIVQKEI